MLYNFLTATFGLIIIIIIFLEGEGQLKTKSTFHQHKSKSRSKIWQNKEFGQLNYRELLFCLPIGFSQMQLLLG